MIATAPVARGQELVASTAAVESSLPANPYSNRQVVVGPSPSSSRGLPWDGELRNGVWLNESSTVRHLPQFRSGQNFYGTGELIGMLQRAGENIARRWTGSRLTVGELSAKQGGWIEGHHSHRNGRDADIAFFMRSRAGSFMPFWRFVAFGRTGPERAIDSHLRFDDGRNWALVAHLLRDTEARVQYIFVAQPIRARLLVEGRNRGESAEFLRAAAAVLVEPQHGHRHENHFHVRIYCARDDRPECEDRSPYWPWFDGKSPEGAYTELPIIRWHPTKTSASTDSAVDATEAMPTELRPAMPAVRPTTASSPPAAPQTTGT